MGAFWWGERLKWTEEKRRKELEVKVDGEEDFERCEIDKRGRLTDRLQQRHRDPCWRRSYPMEESPGSGAQ